MFVEFFGVFFLTLCALGAVSLAKNGTETAVASMKIGVCLAVIIYAGAHVSGGHFNPAVTLAVSLQGSMNSFNFGDNAAGVTIAAIIYMLMQIIGGSLAALIYGGLRNGFGFVQEVGVTAVPDTNALVLLILMELFWSAFLCYVVLHVACTKANGYAGQGFYGAAIGGVVFASNGASMNPAVSIASVIIDKKSFLMAIPVVGPFFGAMLAVGMFWVTSPSDMEADDEAL